MALPIRPSGRTAATSKGFAWRMDALCPAARKVMATLMGAELLLSVAVAGGRQVELAGAPVQVMLKD